MSVPIRHRAVVVDSFGGPGRLRLVDVITKAPEPGFARVKVCAIGVGATDTMARRGEYLMQRRRTATSMLTRHARLGPGDAVLINGGPPAASVTPSDNWVPAGI